MVSYIEPEQARAVVARLGLRARDEGLLFAALARPAAGVLGEEVYPTLPGKAAALCSSLAQGTALVSGNRRLALALTFAFLRINGYTTTFSNAQAATLVADVAEARIELEALTTLTRQHLRPLRVRRIS